MGRFHNSAHIFTPLRGGFREDDRYVYPRQKFDLKGTRGRPPTGWSAFGSAGIVQNRADSIPYSHSTFSLPTMGALKTLAAFTFFFVSSLAASANDWRGRSIYQVGRIHCLHLPTLTANVTSLSRTGSQSRMGPDQPVTRRTASIVVAPTRVS